MDMQEIYLEGQRNCGLEVGDSVKVLRQPKSREYGWRDVAPSKDYKGVIGVITHITKWGVCVDFKNGDDYNYPYFVLEKVGDFKPEYEFKPFAMVLVRDTNDEEWVPAFYAKYRPDQLYLYDTIEGVGYKQCIPYEGNEHLIFTTNSPEE